jgi:hypothetical protein
MAFGAGKGQCQMVLYCSRKLYFLRLVGLAVFISDYFQWISRLHGGSVNAKTS